MKKVLVTTTESLHGWEIESYLKPIFASVALAPGYLSDLSASFTDLFGGRSSSYERRLQTIKDSALNILTSKASELGANCILGLRVDMDQITGKNTQLFMITAYGTAVVAKSPNVKTSTSKELDKTVVEERALQIKLTNKIKDPNYQLTTGGLQIIVDSKSPDFKDYIFEKFKTQVRQQIYSKDLFTTDPILKSFHDYFFNIDPQDSEMTLYKGLINEAKEDLFNPIADLIILLNLLNFDGAMYLLKSESVKKKKLALKILNGYKTYYVIDDIAKIEQVAEAISNAFPSTSSLSTKKGFLSSNEKEVWNCPCGKANPLNEAYCYNCGNDQFGFKSGELSPVSVIETLHNTAAALKEFFAF